MNPRLTLLLLLPLLALAVVACTPEPPTSTASAEGAGPALHSPAMPDTAFRAAQLLSERFSASGEASFVSSVTVQGGLIRVTLDLPVKTLGDADVYMRMCNSLAVLIGAPENLVPISGVQTFGPGGVPVVATGSSEARCSKFYL